MLSERSVIFISTKPQEKLCSNVLGKAMTNHLIKMNRSALLKYMRKSRQL